MLGRVIGTRLHAPAPVADEVPTGVVLRVGRWIPCLGGWLAGQRQPAAAVTLGRTIVVHPDVHLTARLLRHELAHVRQWRQRPLHFPLHYAWMHVRHGYGANPYEVEARNAENSGTNSGTRHPDSA
jgi:hypothetical protein